MSMAPSPRPGARRGRLRRAARGRGRRSRHALRLLVDTDAVWEVALKASLVKLETPPGLAHAEGACARPWHHRDPFDRLLVSHSLCEGAALCQPRRGVPRG